MQLKARATFTSRSEAIDRKFLYRYTYPINICEAISDQIRLRNYITFEYFYNVLQRQIAV